MLQHLKYSLPDWVLCTLASMALSLNVVQSFLLPEGLSRNAFLTAVISAVVIAVLVLCSYSKISVIISAVVFAAGIIGILIFNYLGIVEGFTETADAEANGTLWYLVVIICAAVVYLLSRTRITSWLLLIIGMLAAAYFELMEYTVYLWAALLFMAAVGTWICFIGYRRNMLHISAMRTAFLPMAGWAAAAALICLAVGSLLWLCIIRPLQPPTQDMVLLTDTEEYRRMEELGLISESEIYDESLFSDWLNQNLNEATIQSEEAHEEENGPETEGTQQEIEGTQEEEHSEDLDTDTPSSPMDGFIHWITYDQSHLVTAILLGILILVILAALIVLFLNRRRIWYRRKTKGMDNDTYIRYFYGWFLGRLRRLKMPKPRGDTPLEYADRMETPGRFLDDTGVTWREITEIFVHTAYSGRNAESEDRSRFEQFYKGFFRACRKKKRIAWIWYTLRV